MNTQNLQARVVMFGQSSSIVGLDIKGNLLAVAERSGHVTIRDPKKFNILSECRFGKPA